MVRAEGYTTLLFYYYYYFFGGGGDILGSLNEKDKGVKY